VQPADGYCQKSIIDTLRRQAYRLAVASCPALNFEQGFVK